MACDFFFARSCWNRFGFVRFDITGVPFAGPRRVGQAVVWVTGLVVLDVLLRLTRWRVTAGAPGRS